MKKFITVCMLATMIAAGSLVTSAKVLSPNGADPNKILSPSGTTHHEPPKEDSPKTGDTFMYTAGGLGVALAVTSIASIRYSKKDEELDAE